jgi:TolA-binding protein
MAGLEVEVRCYQHVREYTLGELSAALEHLESQAAAGQGTGSWSSEQLEALRSEVARKRAAEALTQLGDRALDALARKVNSYTSSADNSPFCDAKRALRCTSGSGAGMAGGGSSSRDVCLLEAALESAAAAAAAAADGGRPSSNGSAAALDSGPSSRRVSSPEADGDAGSWPEVGPRLMSGRTTPTASTAPSSRRGSKTAGGPRPAPSITAATPAPATPALSAADPAAAGVEPQDTPAVSAESSSSSAGAGSAVTTSSRRHSSLGGGGGASDGSGTSSGLLSPVRSAAGPSAQEQLQRMQEAWRESVEKDVTCLREVLGQYKEQVERLEMQKKLLLSQVLKLEFSLEEEEGRAGQLQAQAQSLQQQLAQAARERDAARAAAAAATAAAVAATAAAGPGPAGAGSSSGAAAGLGGSDAAGAGGGVSGLNVTLPPLNTQGGNMAFFDAVSDDGWASTPTVDSLLPKIVALWDELYVPLAYRSRFFLCFRGRELFYYEVEARRLEWKRSQMLAGSPDDPPGWQEQQQQPGFGRRSFGGGQGGDGASTPMAGGRGGTTPRPLSAAAAAGLTASSSSLGGLRRRSKELDRAARWVHAAAVVD